MSFMMMSADAQERRLADINTSDAWGIGSEEQTLAEVIEEHGFHFEFECDGFQIVTKGERAAALFDNGGPCVHWLDS